MLNFRILSLITFSILLIFTQNVFQTFSIPLTLPNTKDKKVVKYFNNTLYFRDIMRLSKAAQMRNYMNESVDPCTDFYTFSCGNWAKINPANSAESITTGLFQVMSTALNRKIERILKTGLKPEDNEIDRKVKNFFESCTKFGTQINSSIYHRKLQGIIDEFGTMPALSEGAWNVTSFDWLETVARIAHKYGKDIIISLDIMPDYAMNSVNRIYIGHPDLPLESRSMYLDELTEVYRKAYKDKVEKDLCQFLGLKKALAKSTATEIVEFEVLLARGMVDEKLGHDLEDMLNLTTAEKMTQKYAPTLNVEKLVNITLGIAVYEPIYEFVESYQRNLIKVLESTPKHIVANYIMYSLLSEFFLKVFKRQLKQEKLCMEKTKMYFAKNLDNMIYRHYNNEITEQDITLIWQELKQTFSAELQSNQLDWITLETRQKALQKLNAMKLEINSYERQNLTEEFKELKIDKYDYIGNLKNIMELRSSQAREDLRKVPKPLEAAETFSYTPVNIVLENTVKVPVSLLQPNYLWAASYPHSLKFGTIGALIGHELIHGFDDNGRKFDKDGNHIDWWDSESSNAFDRHTQCFVDQYRNYRYAGRFLPRSLMQSENIADNGGMRIAYSSYLRWLQGTNSSKVDLQLETLPTMPYSNKQLFFISYAQVWCNDAHPRIRDLQTATDTHVPGMFRVIGPLSNFPEFAKEFKCDKDASMNAKRKCQIY